MRENRLQGEPAIWFIAGALGGAFGPAGLSSLLLLPLAENWGLLVATIAVGIVVGALAVVVSRRGGVRSSRLWAAVAWFLISGLVLVIAFDFVADGLSAPGATPPIVWTIYRFALAALSGALAVLLHYTATRLVPERSVSL